MIYVPIFARTRTVPTPVLRYLLPPGPIPSLQPHYRAFITTKNRCAPMLRFGTLASRFSPLVLLP